jgi:hypothetical protein
MTINIYDMYIPKDATVQFIDPNGSRISFQLMRDTKFKTVKKNVEELYSDSEVLDVKMDSTQMYSLSMLHKKEDRFSHITSGYMLVPNAPKGWRDYFSIRNVKEFLNTGAGVGTVLRLKGFTDVTITEMELGNSMVIVTVE